MPRHAAVSGTPPRSLHTLGQSSAIDAPPAGVSQVLAGPGRPLEPDLREDMGRRFGHDFSRVRVHTDERASESAAALGADAYTVGQHVVFRRGAWDPVGTAGRRLIAHELVHTIQQRGSSQPTVACQFGPLPDTLGGVAAEIQMVQQQLLVPVQPLRPALEIRLQALYAQWQRLGGNAQPAATAPKPTQKKLTAAEESALKAQAVQLALLEVQRRSFCMFMNERADWYAVVRLQEPAFREEMKALHVVYDEKEKSFNLDTKWKYTFNSPYADPRSPFYLHFEAAEIYQDLINAYLYPPEEKWIVRRILDPIVHTICEYTEPCSSNMEQVHKDLENGMSRGEAINRGMARLTTQALVAAFPTPGPRGPIALPPGGAPPVVPFDPTGGAPPKTGLTPETVPDVPSTPEPPVVAKPSGSGTAGKLPSPQKPTLIASEGSGGKGQGSKLDPTVDTTLDALGVQKGERGQLHTGAKVWGQVARGRAKLVTYLKFQGKKLTAGVLSSELPKIEGKTVQQVAAEEQSNVIKAYLSFRQQAMILARQLGADTVRFEADVVVNPDLPDSLVNSGFKAIPDSPGSYFKEEPVR